ncbi:MAG: GWxTD domain-containing protein [candidate division Zixibacteria bacterium]|nr:GWxTD domain-containing protein [candidate division Zixibacteria bacterium]
MRYVIAISCAVIIMTGCLGHSAVAESRLTIQAGISVYNNPETGPETYVEFPFVIDRAQLTFLPTEGIGGGVRASIYAQILLTDQQGRPVDSAETYFYTQAGSIMQAKQAGIKVFNKLVLMIPPGTYKAVLTVIDAVSKREGAFLYNQLEIDGPVENRLTLSTIEMAYDIAVVSDSSPVRMPHLVKNDREILPNPMAIYSVDDTVMFVYTELYNLAYDDGSNDEQFAVSYSVRRTDGGLAYDFGTSVNVMPGNSAVLCRKLSVAGWQPGRYDLILTATDLVSHQADTSFKRFVIFPRTGELPEVVSYSMKTPLDSASIKTKSEIIRFLVEADEWVLYNALTDSGKARFVEQFFVDRDPSPGTPENEYLNDVLARYAFANEKFSTLPEVQDGWRTDRGRVLQQYGQWDNREEHIAPSYGRRYEIWRYDRLPGQVTSGIVFVFVDVGGFGDFKLAHSTAKGEVYDPEWKYKLSEEDPDILQPDEPFIR